MKKIFSLMLLALILLTSVVSASDVFCASLRNKKGEVLIERNGQVLQTKDGTHVYPNDSVITGPDGSVGVVFADNSRIGLGPNSRLDLKEFVFKPSEKKFSMVNRLSKGTASVVSGKMTKMSPESVVLETPNSTIGVRGTTFVVKVDE